MGVLGRTVTQQLSEGVLPDSYYVCVVAEPDQAVRVTEVDSSKFLTADAPVLDADFSSGAVSAGRAGQVVEFAAGELTPPRVAARSLTEFVNGELVSAEARAASWSGAGEGSVASEVGTTEALPAGPAVFADGIIPDANHLEAATVVEVQQLSGAFDLAALKGANNLEELRFTWNGDYALTNPNSAQQLKLQRMSAPPERVECPPCRLGTASGTRVRADHEQPRAHR